MTKIFTRQSGACKLAAAICLYGIVSLGHAQTTVFTTPAQYCFPQSEWRGDESKLVFDHHLLVARDEHFKNGDVFVAFRLRDDPERLFLQSSDGVWSPHEAGTEPPGYFSGVLQPVMRLSVIPQPTDVTAFQLGADSDTPANGSPPSSSSSMVGQLLVGYGLRADGASTRRESFQDMLNNQRYSVVWTVGAPKRTAGFVCLTATQMNWDAVSYTQ